MKKIFIALGVAFLAALTIGACFIGFVAYKGSKLDASSKIYVDENLPAIVSTWSKEELIRRASPALLRSVTDEQFSVLFAKLKQLGSLEKYEGAKGQSNMSITTQEGKVISASYIAKATFAKGLADIKITLIQVDDDWKIVGFHVDSPLFLK